MQVKVDVKDGVLRSIELVSLPAKVTTQVADAVMAEISAVVGVKWLAAKVGGCWLIGMQKAEWVPVFGHHPGQQVRAFDKALAHTFKVPVIKRKV